MDDQIGTILLPSLLYAKILYAPGLNVFHALLLSGYLTTTSDSVFLEHS